MISYVSHPGSFPPPLYVGTNCQAEINECEEHPCQNGATCQDHIAMYSCQCVAGFQGLDCEVNIDECASSPCLNKGKCIDRVNRWDTHLEREEYGEGPREAPSKIIIRIK